VRDEGPRDACVVLVLVLVLVLEKKGQSGEGTRDEGS